MDSIPLDMSHYEDYITTIGDIQVWDLERLTAIDDIPTAHFYTQGQLNEAISCALIPDVSPSIANTPLSAPSSAIPGLSPAVSNGSLSVFSPASSNWDVEAEAQLPLSNILQLSPDLVDEFLKSLPHRHSQTPFENMPHNFPSSPCSDKLWSWPSEMLSLKDCSKLIMVSDDNMDS